MRFIKNIRLLIALLLLTGYSFAQNSSHTVKGALKDSTEGPLPAVTVALLNAKDSTLETFCNTDNTGHFELKQIGNGAYLLHVSLLGYKHLYKRVDITANQGDADLGALVLQPKGILLKEANVTADHIPIKIKGDTIEYNANAFKTQPNAVVEDLLKKLPGVEVDKDGGIKANGKTVNKVLVDGKEFFGDDPKAATKNLPADAIDNVQVFDKKSEMAEFTGIDDGQRDRTINLSLKGDKKQGVFGKMSGGYGSQDRYEAKANVNTFRKDLQASVIANSNNTNQQSFSVMDFINFMGGIKNLMSGGGRLSLNSNDLGVPLNFGSPDGFNRTTSGGFNFNYDLGKKTDIRSSYFYSKINKDIYRDVFTRNLLPGNSFNTNETGRNQGENEGHRINLNIKHRIDSSQYVSIKNNISFSDQHNISYDQSNSMLTNGTSINEINNFNSAQSKGYKLSSTLTYLKKLGKKGRSFGTVANLGVNNGHTNESVNYKRLYYVPVPAIDSLNQVNRQNSDQNSYGIKLSYTEPVGKRKYMEVDYAYQKTANTLSKDFYDVLNSPVRMEVPNTALSNRYTSNYFYNRVGYNFKLNGQKFSFTAGLAYQVSTLQGGTSLSLTPVDRKFYALLPSLNYNYNFAATKQLQLSYQTNNNEPQPDQLQPVVNNSNPLNITVGNPDLKPEYVHDARVSYNSFNQFNFTNLFTALSTTYTQNKITYKRDIGADLVQVSTPVNVASDFALDGYVSFGTAIRKLKIKANASLNSLYNRGITFINGTRNNSDRYVNTLDVNIENRKKDLVDAVIGAKFSENTIMYSISNNQNQSFLNKTFYAEATTYLPRSFSINAALDYNIYAGSAFSDKQKVPILKASMAKQFLKNKRGELKLGVYDILNQNKGINRTANYNYIQEERIRSLGRYVMLSFTYSLSKFPAKENGGIQFKNR